MRITKIHNLKEALLWVRSGPRITSRRGNNALGETEEEWRRCRDTIWGRDYDRIHQPCHEVRFPRWRGKLYRSPCSSLVAVPDRTSLRHTNWTRWRRRNADNQTWCQPQSVINKYGLFSQIVGFLSELAKDLCGKVKYYQSQFNTLRKWRTSAPQQLSKEIMIHRRNHHVKTLLLYWGWSSKFAAPRVELGVKQFAKLNYEIAHFRTCLN